MHEVSIVHDLIESVERQLARQNVSRATAVRLRRGSTFSEEALCQSFAALSQGTRLEGAVLLVEEVETLCTCAGCGHTQSVTADDLVGHMVVCPVCGHVQEIDEVHDLELLAVEGIRA